MNLQESIRRILREETESGKYTKIAKAIADDFKTEDFVCDIDVYYYADKYEVAVKINKKEFEKKYENIDINYANILMKGYLDRLKRTIRQEIKSVLPVEVLVWFKQINCDKGLNESENKKSGLLRAIEEDGLYEVMQDTGLCLPKIYTKTGELPREVFERYVKDFLENDEIGLDLSIPISPNKRADSFYLSDGVVTIELNELDSIGRVVAGSFERLSALSDEEIFSLVDEMTQINNDFLDYM